MNVSEVRDLRRAVRSHQESWNSTQSDRRDLAPLQVVLSLSALATEILCSKAAHEAVIRHTKACDGRWSSWFVWHEGANN